jgi:hypothetical protein
LGIRQFGPSLCKLHTDRHGPQVQHIHNVSYDEHISSTNMRTTSLPYSRPVLLGRCPLNVHLRARAFTILCRTLPYVGDSNTTSIYQARGCFSALGTGNDSLAVCNSS